MLEGLKVKLDKLVGIQPVEIKAFCGVMGSGKGYKCQQLINSEGYVQIDFADGLREMVWKMLEWKPKNAEEYDLFKKSEFFIPAYGKLNGRLLLQRIGATMRELDPDFWVKQWKKAVDKALAMGYNKICCSDCRYENEIKMIKSYSWKAKAEVEFCDYHSDRYNAESTHESEAMAIRLLKEGYKDGDLI